MSRLERRQHEVSDQVIQRRRFQCLADRFQ